VCHHCGERGHIRPFCFKLHGYPEWYTKTGATSSVPNKKEWKTKSNETGLVAHATVEVSSSEAWYFDSGCFKHMTGIAGYLKDLKPYKAKSVVFGDGGKGEIMGIGKLINNQLPKQENVLLVGGLTKNLISISQLCDQGLEVNFTKYECFVTNDLKEIVMKGIRSKENCYVWTSLEGDHPCTRSYEEEEETSKQIRLSDYKIPLLASPKSLSQHKNDSIKSIRAAINSLQLDWERNVQRDAAASSSQTNTHHDLLKAPMNIREALLNEDWIEVMQEELIQLKRSDVWKLVPRPEGTGIMETNWIFEVIPEEDGVALRKQVGW
jgi:hypothetical protein